MVSDKKQGGLSFEVRIRDDVERSWEILRVWARTPDEALEKAIAWIDAISRRPLSGSFSEVTQIGHVPSTENLGIATSAKDVSYSRTTLSGERLSTPFSTAKDEVLRLTNALRQGAKPHRRH